MAAAGSSFDLIHSTLEGLRRSFDRYHWTDEFGNDVDRFDDVNKDWMFLRTLWESVDMLRNGDDEADKVFNLGLKIEAAAKEIAQDVVLIDKKKMKTVWVDLQFLYDYGTKTKNLMAEIGEDLDQHLSGFSFQLRRPSPHVWFWSRFVSSVASRMGSIEPTSTDFNALASEMRSLQNYLNDVLCSDVDYPVAAAAAAGGDDVIDINASMNRVASEIVHLAIHTCDYWFSYRTNPGPIQEKKWIKLSKFAVDLQHEIDPTNPKFMEFHLHFLIALYKTGQHQVKFCRKFCNYVATKSGAEQVLDEVSWLVKFLVSSKLEEEDQFLPIFFAEIHAVLVVMASVFKKQRDECPKTLHSELVMMICLLQTELFLTEIALPKIKNSTFQIEDQLDQMKDQVCQKLGKVRRYSKNLPSGKAEYGNKILALIEQLYYSVASLCRSFKAKKINKSTVKNSILLLLLNIVILKAESLNKSSNAANFLVYRKGQIALLEQLNLFTLLSNHLMTVDMDMFFSQTEIFTTGMMTEGNKNMILSSLELLDKVKRIKAKLREVCPQVPLSDFPKTYRPGFIDFLLRNLEDLLKYDPSSIAPVKHHIKEVQLQFKSLSSIFMKASESDISENPELKDFLNCAANIAYKIEYVIDLIEIDAQWQHFFLVFDLLEELRIVNKRASGIHLTTSDDGDRDYQNLSQVPLNKMAQDGIPLIKETVVDISDEEQVITDQLTKGSARLGIVSIVGMPGIGKTTMAWKLFNCPKVLSHFHCRAWCTVSQEYEKKELLLEILGGIHGLNENICQMSKEDLQLKLRQCLLRNKFLIVMDDVWDAGVWNELKISFPDDANGSRVLITSRHHDVALQIEPNGDPHSLRLFSDDESWNLIVGRVFQGESCPEELLLVGKEIAQKCKGLPLAVVAISGLLRRIENSRESWEKIAKSLIAKVMEDPKARCMEILELSYKYLPGYLKPCFIYLGVFLEDKDIPVSKLTRFWLAEGCIHDSELKSLEGIAEGYLMELISRSLVEVSKRRSNGMVKSCRLHDLLRDFCQLKARAENFFQLVTRFDEPYVSFPSSDFGFEFDFGHHSDPVTYEAYRLCIFLKRVHFVVSRPFGLGTRSLIFFPSADSEPRCPYDISFICSNFKLLRVLDFECINLGITFPADISLLVHLRYLAVTGYMQTIPQSIANLQKLETFVVKGLRGLVVLPDTIWQMARLRHLHVNMHVAFKLDDEGLEGCSQLGNLVSFSRLSLSCGEDVESIIKRLPNLQKLRCIFFHPQGSSKNSYQFPRLDFLTHLVSLNVFYYGSAITREFILPSNLRKLTLSNFRLPWSHISTIGRLPNLEVLKLLLGAFEGLTWDMEEEQFKELKFLMLDNLNVSQWNATCDHLPKLQRLVLQNCKDLEEIPYDFADIGTLEVIEVHWCGQSAEESAKWIAEATGDIKVLISSSYLR
ncbi:late blight resistance protein R1-A-like [Coffea eugenioides]|uniref:late blight resistance protein R1-A-like n=1 Tax=Coffea eugenioides TaxID=49369 RepID=UPI000F609238|nr:late blight resistance protein R1-A-like [Coffea eugenioides]